MKKFLIIVLSVFFTFPLFAKHVGFETAQKVAKTFITQNVLKSSIMRGINLTEVQSTYVNFYVFNIDKGNGFVIVSAEDAAMPILGYSTSGSFSPENIPSNVAWWLGLYNDEIQYAIDNNIEASETLRADWNNLMAGNAMEIKSTRAVSAVMTTTWNQSSPYNNLCPSNAPTGCVATAMAQVMKYWNHPVKGLGSHSYSSNYGTLSANFGNTTYAWSNMPNSVSYGSSSTQKNAVATLMYHCGVAVEMNYSANSSGAQVNSYNGMFDYCTETALKNFFDYKNTLRGLMRDSYSDSEWISILKEELNAPTPRPILYTGASSGGGHAFVFDGYNNSNQFHVNWGWGGSYDGYFSINALEPGSGGIGGGDYVFNEDQTALVGVEPNDPHLVVYPTRVVIPANGGNASLVVRKNTSSSSNPAVGEKPDWIQATIQSPSSTETTLTISVSANPGFIRTGIVVINQGSETVNVTVIQESSGECITAHENIFTNPEYHIVSDGAPYIGNNGSFSSAAEAITVEGSDWNKVTSVEYHYNVTGTEGSVTFFIKKATITGSIGANVATKTVSLSELSAEGNVYTWVLDEPVTIEGNFYAGCDFPSTSSGYFGLYVQEVSTCTLWVKSGSWRTIYSASGNQYNFASWILPTYCAINTFDVAVSANPTAGGTLTGGGTFEELSDVTVNATPKTGYDFVNWTDNGSVVSENRAYTFQLVSDRTLVANFQKKIYTISATANPSEGGSVVGAGQYEHGETVTLVATPNTNYEFVNWTKGGEEVSTTAEYSFVAKKDSSFVANFRSTVSINTIDLGEISIYPNPSNGTFTINFASVSGDVTYQLIDARGAIVETRKMNVLSGDEITFENKLTYGIYLIRLISKESIISQQIVVE